MCPPPPPANVAEDIRLGCPLCLILFWSTHIKCTGKNTMCLWDRFRDTGAGSLREAVTVQSALGKSDGSHDLTQPGPETKVCAHLREDWPDSSQCVRLHQQPRSPKTFASVARYAFLLTHRESTGKNVMCLWDRFRDTGAGSLQETVSM